MLPSHESLEQSEATAIPWISLSDIFLVSTIFFLTIGLHSMVFSSNLGGKYHEDVGLKKLRIQELEQEKKELEQKQQELEQEKKELEQKQQELEQENKNLTLMNEQMKQENEDWQKNFGEIQRAMIEENKILVEKNAILQDTSSKVHQGVLGLRGNMQRIAFIFDRSHSMGEQTEQGCDRWQEANAILQTWMTHLPMKECVLITYNTQVDIFSKTDPDTQTYSTVFSMDGKQGDEIRQEMCEWMKNLSPKDQTNTEDALKKSIENNVDTIILFTDGEPNICSSDTFVWDEKLKKVSQEKLKKIKFNFYTKRILDFCEQQENMPPINVVALGPYYREQDFVSFLLRLASITKGSFQAR